MVLEILAGLVLVGFLYYVYKHNKKNDVFAMPLDLECQKCGFAKDDKICPYCRE